MRMCVCRLDNFDGPAVAEKAIEAGLAEEAYEIYRKFNKKVEAIKVRGGERRGARVVRGSHKPQPTPCAPAEEQIFARLCTLTNCKHPMVPTASLHRRLHSCIALHWPITLRWHAG